MTKMKNGSDTSCLVFDEDFEEPFGEEYDKEIESQLVTEIFNVAKGVT